MDPSYTLTVEEHPAPEDVQRVDAGLSEFNLRFAEAENHITLNIFLRDAGGQIVAGLLGDVFWRWLHVGTLWVDDRLRGQGWGRELMRRAEDEAAAHGCLHAQLETHDFQALTFYQKLGYRVFGQLDDFPPGFKKYWLVKDLPG